MLFNRKAVLGKQALVVATVIALLAGCASIMSGKTQSVTIQSTPAGAAVTLGGAPLGVTPFTTLLEKKQNQTLTVSKEGYRPFTTQMTTTIDGWFWGNIVLGGVFGSTTDALNGAMYEYAPNQYLVTLEPEGGSKTIGPAGKSKKDKAREFIILSYNLLMADIAKGTGSYQSSLITLLEVAKDDEEAAIKRIKALSQAFPDIAQFADQVANAFIK